jgi:transcriptional regulator with XRE-family HTH domain
MRAAKRAGRARAQDADRHVGARMRERRIMLGLTQQEMAELIGVTYQQAHKYEKGINRVAAGRLYNIAQGLGLPSNDQGLWQGGNHAGESDDDDVPGTQW